MLGLPRRAGSKGLRYLMVGRAFRTMPRRWQHRFFRGKIGGIKRTGPPLTSVPSRMNSGPSTSQIEPVAAIRISVIVPLWNEATNLPACLARVGPASDEIEVIIVDAGSRDGSADIARTLGATVLISPALQRAAQMNFGAWSARGDVLVFLHADTLLPVGWPESLRNDLLRRPDAVGGVFRRRFLRPSIFLRATCWLADWRARQFGWFLGDQTIFVRRTTFDAAGGYHPLTAFEDLEFSRRLKKIGRTIVLPATAFSSGRRFEARGPFRQTLADIRLTRQFLRNPQSFVAASENQSG